MGTVCNRARTQPQSSRKKVACSLHRNLNYNSLLFYLKYIPKVLQDPLKSKKKVDVKIITVIGCCVSGIIKLAIITEWWAPQSNHFFSIYLVITML